MGDMVARILCAIVGAARPAGSDLRSAPEAVLHRGAQERLRELFPVLERGARPGLHGRARRPDPVLRPLSDRTRAADVPDDEFPVDGGLLHGAGATRGRDASRLLRGALRAQEPVRCGEPRELRAVVADRGSAGRAPDDSRGVPAAEAAADLRLRDAPDEEAIRGAQGGVLRGARAVDAPDRAGRAQDRGRPERQRQADPSLGSDVEEGGGADAQDRAADAEAVSGRDAGRAAA